MSLLGILNLSGSALAAQQAALQVTSNNLANAANPNYNREVAQQQAAGDSPSSSGLLLGNGVNIVSVQRQVDEALTERLRSADSDQSAASTAQTWSGQVQSVFNALSGNGLSDQLNTFFNDWSSLANNPTSVGQRQVVLQDGANVSQAFNSLSSNLSTIGGNIQNTLGQSVQQFNQLSAQVASLNTQIVAAQAGGQQPNSLLDQRDTTLAQMAQMANIQTVNQPSGSVNVYLNNETLVSTTGSQTLTASQTTTNGQVDEQVNFADGSTANISSGQIGGLLQSQALVDQTASSVNSLASNLITSLNSVYSGGQGLSGFTNVAAANSVTDPTQPLTSAGLKYPPANGSFTVTLTDSTTGQITNSALVPVTETGSPGDTTLNSLAASLNGISGVQATVNNGRLSIASTNPNVQISFGQDTSGALSGLGINTFFNGSSAATIAVNSTVATSPNLLAASGNGDPDDNTIALAIAGLNDAPQAGLSGSSLSQAYGALVQGVGSAAATATGNAASTAAVQQTLTSQQQSLSGVSTDEEALNMIIEQRTYQGAAQLISVVNQMLQTLLAIT